MKIIITGANGFIGFHLAQKLLENKENSIWGVDNNNDYYSVDLKKDREKILSKNRNFTSLEFDVESLDFSEAFAAIKPDIVIHLAAQAGVRYSLENPKAYIKSNIDGFLNVLESCRAFPVKHLIYASSSSVYGGNDKVPFDEDDNVDHPVSLYAATKKSNELMAHTYSHLFNIPSTGLRFFTVYGPWGRPDMAYFSFTKNIIDGKTIKVFNKGKMERDFTYIDDIVNSITRLIPKPPTVQENEAYSTSTSWSPYRVLNIGNNNPVKLMEFINIIENAVGFEANKEYFDMQQGDVVRTYADTEKLENITGYKPSTSLSDGIQNFVDWYKEYYKVEVD